MVSPLCSYVLVFSSRKDTSHIELVLTHMSWLSLNFLFKGTTSSSEVLGVKNSTYTFGGDNSAHNRIPGEIP